MEKICLIKQPAGVGDIFFCLKIAKRIQADTEYKKIIWPVASTYSYLNRYLVADGIDFCDENSPFPLKNVYQSHITEVVRNEDFVYLPLQTANYSIKACTCHNNPLAFGHMKYDFCKMTHEDWMDYFDFKRDLTREQALVKKLGLDLSEPYNLINKNYGTYPYFLTRNDLIPSNNFKNVYMDFYNDVTLFDWITIFEHAYEIHTLATSIAFILEKMDFKNVTIYSRHRDIKEDFSDVKSKYNQAWKFVN